jgi:hypothetical protein
MEEFGAILCRNNQTNSRLFLRNIYGWMAEEETPWINFYCKNVGL